MLRMALSLRRLRPDSRTQYAMKESELFRAAKALLIGAALVIALEWRAALRDTRVWDWMYDAVGQRTGSQADAS